MQKISPHLNSVQKSFLLIIPFFVILFSLFFCSISHLYFSKNLHKDRSYSDVIEIYDASIFEEARAIELDPTEFWHFFIYFLAFISISTLFVSEITKNTFHEKTKLILLSQYQYYFDYSLPPPHCSL